MCRNNYSVENLGAYSEPGQTSKMEHFAKRINDAQGSTTLLRKLKKKRRHWCFPVGFVKF